MPDLAYKASIKALLSYLAELDPVVGPIELRCGWFDDLYRPGDKHTAIYSPVVWKRGLREFEACFTADELSLLSEFNRVFEAENDALPTGPDWDRDPGWLKVRDAARTALMQLQQLDEVTK